VSLKKTAAIASQSLQEVIPLVKPGVREWDVAVELEYMMRKKGAEGPAFQFIVASGPRSALPHGVASNKKIENGNLVTIDFGAIRRGYTSDETCTLVIGKPTPKQRKIYQIVKDAHDHAIAAVRPGKSFKEIDAVARNYINAKGYKAYFNHGTGHGIGLCVHEPPLISFRGEGNIQKDMVFTIEPGIYLPGWGGVRIEDTILVTSKGCEIITAIDKSLLII
jgi:Xaa-Pro aminopeptidase